jgi:hypothetical protein
MLKEFGMALLKEFSDDMLLRQAERTSCTPSLQRRGLREKGLSFGHLEHLTSFLLTVSFRVQ